MYGSGDAIMEASDDRRKAIGALKALLKVLGEPEKYADTKLVLAIERARQVVKELG